MRNISDNELDKLFQDAAQRIEPEFDPGDWDKLSKRIDRTERVNLFKRIAIYLSVVLLLMFSAWFGIKYYQGKSDAQNNSVSNNDSGIENEISDHPIKEEKENGTDTNAPAKDAGIDSDDDNGKPTGSSAEGEEASASTQDQKGGETSSSVDKHSSGSITDKQKSKDIAAADQDPAIASTSGDQSTEQNTSGSKNASGKSGQTTKRASTSTRNKDQNGNTINKTAEGTTAGNDQQSIQKQKRAVAGEKENRDGSSLSASGNDSRIEKNKALTSADQQKKKIANKEESSATSNTSSRSDNAAQSAINAVSSDGTKNGKQDANIASDSKRLSSASVHPVTGTEQDDVNASSDASAGVDTDVDVKKNSATGNNQATSANNNKSKPAGEVTANTLNSSPDSSAIVNARGNEKNNSMSKDDAALKSTAANQSGNANPNIAGADSLSAEKSVLRSKDNTWSGADAKNVSGKSTGLEKTTGLVSNDASVKKSISKEDSLRGTAPVGTNAYQESKSISDNDSVLVAKKVIGNRNETSKVETGVVKNAKTQPVSNEADIVSGSDSVSNKEAEYNSKALNTSDKNGAVLPVKKDDAAAKSTEEKYNGVATQDTPPTTGILLDSVNNQSESATKKSYEKSNSNAINDSTLIKPVAKADSLKHTAGNETAEDKQKEDKEKVSNWYAKLLVSPDFSAIGYSKPGKTGVNIGLVVEYSPAKHWGISTGAIWSKKLYDKTNPGKAYSYGGTSFEADYLDGDCRVLDIPINIIYYILPEARLNFYATVGVSSYIMLKENYEYVVNENNTNYYYYEDYKNQNRHWFSMLNLSFGLQYRISPRMQLQAEPFLKAPMSGVGQGKIDLVSAGSFFTLKYRFK